MVALFANIESREWRRAYNAKSNILPEHPRSSTTDDVECFFSVLRDSVGKDFTLQEVKSLRILRNSDFKFWYITKVYFKVSFD